MKVSELMLRSLLHRPLLSLLIAAILAAQPAGAEEFRVEPITIPEMKAVFGQVESRIVVPARARIGGTIHDLRITQGDEVSEGEIIATVVDDKIALQLNAAEAKIKALESQLENARIRLERAQELRARGVGTQASLDQENMQFIVATNDVSAARAEKAVIEQNAREGTVFAPASGRVLTVPVTPGSVIMPGEEIGRIAPGPYYLRLSLPERHAAEIVQGSDVVVGERGLAQLDEGNSGIRKGRIVKVYPEIEDGRVIADVEVAGIGDYFVNERALVSIPVGKRRALAVPPEAVRTVHGVDYIRIAAATGEMNVAVILGEVFDVDGAARVEVLTGLHAGDRVVLP